MKKIDIRKLAMTSMLVALAVVCSPLSIPVGASKCYPVQHLVNVIAGVYLGPWYGILMAFCTSLIRNILGTGSLLAFPGSMCGALLSGLLYRYGKKLFWAYIGELFGTSVIGGMLCYPVALLLMGNQEAALFGYVFPFFLSSLAGTIIAVVLVTVMKRFRILDRFLTN